MSTQVLAANKKTGTKAEMRKEIARLRSALTTMNRAARGEMPSEESEKAPEEVPGMEETDSETEDEADVQLAVEKDALLSVELHPRADVIPGIEEMDSEEMDISLAVEIHPPQCPDHGRPMVMKMNRSTQMIYWGCRMWASTHCKQRQEWQQLPPASNISINLHGACLKLGINVQANVKTYNHLSKLSRSLLASMKPEDIVDWIFRTALPTRTDIALDDYPARENLYEMRKDQTLDIAMKIAEGESFDKLQELWHRRIVVGQRGDVIKIEIRLPQ